MTMMWRDLPARPLGAGLLLLGLTGCVVPPPVLLQPSPYVQQSAAQQQAPFVAVPGPGKTAQQFQADDAFCRSPAVATRNQAASVRTAATDPANPPITGYTPGVGYLQCMEAHNNSVQPMAQSAAPPPVYGYLQTYPVYAGSWYGYGYPWYYGSLGFGYYGGYGGYGYGGYGFGYGGYGGGYRGYGGGYGRGGYGGGYGRGGYGGGYGGGGGGGGRGGFGGGGGGGGGRGGR